MAHRFAQVKINIGIRTVGGNQNLHRFARPIYRLVERYFYRKFREHAFRTVIFGDADNTRGGVFTAILSAELRNRAVNAGKVRHK